ncbi:carboxymuconolactone decarboxylase family protein [Tamaricihabitans halophyticus]|nr:carboxymuconolactone decarboxylase family protein [Tamaricihabitans halophyticus]
MTLTQKQVELKEKFTELHGSWDDSWESMLRLDPAFFESYLRFSGVPWKSGPDGVGYLEPKVKQFVYVAASAAATHLYLPGVRRHVRAAVALGASAEEVMEVLELASTLGIHACNIGVPLLLEVLEEEGVRDPAAVEPLDQRRVELKREFTDKRGYWHPFWEGVLELDPDFFAAYLEFSAVPWVSGVLSPKVKELVYIAFDAAATHLYEPGMKLHMRNAVRYGASAHEIMEVLEIVSVIGIHGCVEAAPILRAELERAERG